MSKALLQADALRVRSGTHAQLRMMNVDPCGEHAGRWMEQLPCPVRSRERPHRSDVPPQDELCAGSCRADETHLPAAAPLPLPLPLPDASGGESVMAPPVRFTRPRMPPGARTGAAGGEGEGGEAAPLRATLMRLQHGHEAAVGAPEAEQARRDERARGEREGSGR
jgi:hypothetical protein